MALCPSWFGRQPVAWLLDPKGRLPLAALGLTSASLLGGVYAYLDNRDRLVMVDGQHDLVRVAATSGRWFLSVWWRLSIEDRVSLAPAVTGHCGGGDCDAVVAIAPDGQGSVWFVTRRVVAGVYHPSTGALEHIVLGDDETVHNSFSTTNDGRAAVATDRALYLLATDRRGRPSIEWRRQYDRGSARKPGQLSHGTGATPTFFGPSDGSDYVTITDNADGQLNLLGR